MFSLLISKHSRIFGVCAASISLQIQNVHCERQRRVENKVIVVAGGASGIGAETAKLLAREGNIFQQANLYIDSKKSRSDSCSRRY